MDERRSRIKKDILEGCVCFVHLSPHECHKLGTQFVQCAFMVYNIVQKGFVCYHGILFFFIFRDVVFLRISTTPKMFSLLIWHWLLALRMTMVL